MSEKNLYLINRESRITIDQLNIKSDLYTRVEVSKSISQKPMVLQDGQNSLRTISLLSESVLDNLAAAIKGLLDAGESLEVLIVERYRSNEYELLTDVKLCPIINIEYRSKNGIYCKRMNSDDLINQVSKYLLLKKSMFIETDFIDFTNLYDIPLVFVSSASETLSHEIFGHIFEIDNYIKYNYASVINQVSQLNLNICDNPLLLPELCLSERDDVLNKTSLTTIFDNGIYTGELIGGSAYDKLCRRSFRRSSFLVQAIPRMSTLSVRSNRGQKENSCPRIYVQISSIKRAQITHKTMNVQLYITNACLICDEKKIAFVRNFTIDKPINEFLSRLEAIQNTKGDVSAVVCQKWGQILTCGIISDDWCYDPGR